ncbi:ATP-dependent RNA helicase [Venturia inaequalis]|nr:ATP-dependent RNA helicase [Venturia inaequalis]
MCPYYAYTFTCGHTQTVFAQCCKPAQISQRRCTTRSPAATIPITFKMDHECEECVMNCK